MPECIDDLFIIICLRNFKESLTGTLNAHKAFLDWTEPMVEVQAAQAASSSTGQSVATTTGFASVTSSPFGPGGPGPTGPTGPTGASASPFGGGTTPSPFAAAQATSAGPVTSSPFAQPAGPFAPVATGDGRSVSPFAATGQVSWSESKGSLFYSRDWTKNVHSLYQDCIGYIVIRNIVACTTVILLL